MSRNIPSPAFVLALFACCCSPPKDDPQCDGTVEVNFTSAVPAAVSGDLLVQGSVEPSRNIAVRSVTVAGIEAEPQSFNYRTWSATVPFATLLNLKAADPSAPDDVDVLAEAVTACDSSASSDPLTVHLVRPPAIAVDTLTLTATFPGDHMYLPADGGASTVVQVTSDPGARGATVNLQATGQGHFSGANGTLSLVLAGDGKSPAMTTALVTGAGVGTIFLTASAAGVAATPLQIVTAAAPKLFPPTADLLPGQSVLVVVDKTFDAQRVTCTTQSGEGLVVTGASDSSSFTVTAAKDLSAPAQATIDCRDDFGQTTHVTYSAAPES